MHITKYLHSCLLVEDQGKTILFDPGEYTYNEHALDINALTSLDHVFITHEHPDHCYPLFIKDLLTKFPNASVISNDSVVTKLREEEITVITTLPDFANAEPVPHEEVGDFPVPHNTLFTLFDTFADPGDSHHFYTTAKVLALPMQAPWGSWANAMKVAIELKPAFVIPVHDWHWKEEYRKQQYERSKKYLGQFNIEFLPMETGQRVEIE